MKSWILRLSALGLVAGTGTVGVIVAQRHWGAQDAPPPNWSAQPVNAEAMATLAGGHSGDDRYSQSASVNSPDAAATEAASAAGKRAPIDPFQGISTANSATDYRSGGNEQRSNDERTTGAVNHVAVNDQNVVPASGDDGVHARTSATEPRQLATDANAAPLAPEPPATQRTAASDIPSSNDAGIPAGRNEPRHMDSGARTASGIVAATGSVETVNDDRQTVPTTPSVASSRYGDPAASPPDYRRLPAANDLKAEPPAMDSTDTAAARGLPTSPAGANSLTINNIPDRSSPGAMMPDRSSPSAMMPDHNSASAGISERMQPGAVPGNGAYANQMPPATAMPITNASQGNGFSGGAGGVIAASSNSVNVEGFGKPGDKKLEGAQTPSVTIQKTAPAEIQVGKEATFEIVVRNTGPVQADDVQVTDVVPQGTRLMNTTPRTNIGPRGEIVWAAGDLKPGEESKLQVQVMPLQEGEIGSTAVVQFRSAASVRTVATKPDLVLELGAPTQVLISEDVKMQIKISNPGTGAANKVVLSAHIPPNFQHPAGNDLEFEIGQFHPGETRDLDLILHAVQAGPSAITFTAQADANLHVEKTANIEIVAPRLEVKLAGPGMRYLDRQAKYTVTVSNPGTAPAKDITLVTHLPKGLQFVEASDSGQYDTASNSISWGLDELPPGQSGNVTLTAMAKEAGDQKLRSEVKSAGGLTDANEQVTAVESVAAVNFTVTHLEDPVEVGGQATYEIHVTNQGSKAANRLQVVAVFPPEIKPVSGDGPSRQAIEGQRIAFEPLARLAPKGDATYRVVGQCLAPGDLRVQVLLQTDDMAKPVIKEEGTRAYKD